MRSPLNAISLGGLSYSRCASVRLIVALSAVLVSRTAPAADISNDKCRSQIPSALRDVLKARHPGHRLPLVTDSPSEYVDGSRQHGGNRCLSVATGDYDGDGHPEFAVLMRPKRNGDVVLVEARATGAKWRLTTLGNFDASVSFVKTGKPGKYERSEVVYAEGEPFGAGEVHLFMSDNPCVIIGQHGSWAKAYCLGPKGWRYIWISD